jgi:hypothetical protein
MVVGDFNGNGRPDIATANQGSNNISILLQNSDGTFQAAVNYAVGNGPLSLQVGDVNGDGKLDLVVINSGDNTIGVLLGNGDGTFQAQKLTTIPANSTQMVVEDFNGDGKADVAVAEPLPQVGNFAVAVLLSNGNGTFQSPVTYPVNRASQGLGVADINHDGKLDIVSVGYGVSAGISVLPGNGDGTFQSAVNSATQTVFMGSKPVADCGLQSGWQSGYSVCDSQWCREFQLDSILGKWGWHLSSGRASDVPALRVHSGGNRGFERRRKARLVCTRLQTTYRHKSPK